MVDTNIWIHHFRRADARLQAELISRNVVMHPLITAELALGSIPDRLRTLDELDSLPQLRVAGIVEVRMMIEFHSLQGHGIGLVDAHLLASSLMTLGTTIWTRDKRLRDVAQSMGVAANVPSS